MTMIVMPMIYRWFDTPPKKDSIDSSEGEITPTLAAIEAKEV